MNLETYWHKAFSMKEYLEIAKERATNNPDKNDEHQEYYELGLQRMERALKTYRSNENLEKEFKNKKFGGKILIISEPWCGDASATVPPVSKFFEENGIEVRIFLRDSDTDLIENFLTNGAQSIPKVIILNENFSVKNSWGPRPEFGNNLLKKFKVNPQEYSKEQFYNDLQVYYAKNRGKDAIHEIINLL